LNLRHFLLPYLVLIILMLCCGEADAEYRTKAVKQSLAIQQSILVAANEDSSPDIDGHQSSVVQIENSHNNIQGSTYIRFPTTNRRKWLQGGGYLVMPPTYSDGQPPVPIMFIMHGSGGIFEEREVMYARELASMGVAAFIIDSFVPRGITDTIGNQRQVSNRDFANDAFSALRALSDDPRIDTVRSGVMGFSKSGQVAMLTALKDVRVQLRIKKHYWFKAHYLFYPACNFHFYDKSTTGVPITFFLADKDNYTGVTQCIDLANELKEKGGDVTTIVYPDTYHGWDVPGFEYMPTAEVHIKCSFHQNADGTWNEQFSGIKHIPDMNGDVYEKALRACVTRGVTVRSNSEVRGQAIDMLKQLIQKQVVEFKLPEQTHDNDSIVNDQ